MTKARKRTNGASAGSPNIRKRNPARSKEAILKAATAEFCRHGFKGARVEEISRRSKINMRLLYHYFDNKDGLYLAVLERVYTEIRAEEQGLNLEAADPIDGMRRLIDFTFLFFARRPDYITLLNNENMLRGQFLKRSPKVKKLTLPLMAAITDLLVRGRALGVFRNDVDPVQLYVTITALSYFHVSNRYTLSAMFDVDLTRAEWLEERRLHAQDLILTWLTASDARPPVVRRRARKRLHAVA